METNEKGEPTNGKWMRRLGIFEWRNIMGDQRIQYKTMGSQVPCFKGVQMPHTKDRKMEENMVGKDVWMERWCKGYCVEERKACLLPKHV